MSTNNTKHEGLTRRELLKGSGLALGGLALASAMGSPEVAFAVTATGQCDENGCAYPTNEDTEAYHYPNTLPVYSPSKDQAQLDADEMRITFLGSGFPPAHRAQQMMSIFVEIGPWIPGENGYGRATDSFVFDCGSGVVSNYNAMGISYGRMDKIFITHLHGDHMSDLTTIYCFGPAGDRKSPLYVWGPGPSGIACPAWGTNPRKQYNDGTKAFCKNLRAAMRWHSESFSFLPTRYEGYQKPTRRSWGLPHSPVPVGDDPANDGFAMVPIELNWRKVGGVAYNNPATGVKITHFPVIHARKGSIGYKLEWNGLSMIYTGDTRPETNSIAQANNVDPATGEARGVDVFIHEMILPPELMAMKGANLSQPYPGLPIFDKAVDVASTVIESSHTPQGAFGYLLSQINPRPRLTVACHFPVANDTVACALRSVQAHFPAGDYPQEGRDIIWPTDLLVLRVKKGQITQMQAQVPDLANTAPQQTFTNLRRPKYHNKEGDSAPTAQLDLSTLIPPVNEDGSVNYCANGY
jgi:ribonuclease Z